MRLLHNPNFLAATSSEDLEDRPPICVYLRLTVTYRYRYPGIPLDHSDIYYIWIILKYLETWIYLNMRLLLLVRKQNINKLEAFVRIVILDINCNSKLFEDGNRLRPMHL